MLKTLLFLRSAFRKQGLWLLLACIAIFSLQFVAISWLAIGDGTMSSHSSRWAVFAVVLGLSVALGVVLLTWLHHSVMMPVSTIVADMEQLIDRARLMQSAMQPALGLLADGIDRQGRMVDSLRQRFDVSHMDPFKSFPLKGEDEKRHNFIVTTLKNLRADMASRRDVARTLSSATLSIGTRLSELEDAIIRLRAMVQNEEPPRSKTWVDDEETPSFGQGGYASSYEVGYGATGAEPSSGEPLRWLDEVSKPLMSDFKFPDDKLKRRFKMN